MENGFLVPVEEPSGFLTPVDTTPSLSTAPPETLMQKASGYLKDLVSPHAPGTMNPADVADAQIKMEARGKGLSKEGYLRIVNPANEAERRAGRLAKGVTAGAVSTVEGMAGGLEWITNGKLGRDLANEAKLWGRDLSPEEHDFSDSLASGVGSMATFFVPGMGVAKGATAMAKVSPRLASWLGSGTATAMEAMTEAGQVYGDALNESKDVSKAESAATKTFWLNVPLLAITNKLGVFGEKGARLRRAIMSATMEGSQEGGQEIISTKSAGKPVDWGNVGESAAVGAITGGLFSLQGPQPAAKGIVPPPAPAPGVTPPPPPGPTVPPAVPVTPAPEPVTKVSEVQKILKEGEAVKQEYIKKKQAEAQAPAEEGILTPIPEPAPEKAPETPAPLPPVTPATPEPIKTKEETPAPEIVQPGANLEREIKAVPQADETKDRPSFTPTTFREYSESQGHEWPFKASNAAYKQVRAGWEAIKNGVQTPKVRDASAQVTALRRNAEGLTSQIEAKKNSATSQQRPTARRANMAAGMYEEGERLERIQKTMNRVADAAEAGDLPASLGRITTRTQVEQLDRAINTISHRGDTSPDFTRVRFGGYVHPAHLKELLEKTKGGRGLSEARAIVSRFANDGYFNGESDSKAISSLLRVQPNQWARADITDFNRLLSLGVTDRESYVSLLKDFHKFRQGKSAVPEKTKLIKQKEAALIGAKIPSYFPTPRAIVDHMLAAADIKPGDRVLEPEAGKGNIADAIRETSPEADLSVIEHQYNLAEILKLKDHKVIGSDFLEHKGQYDKIVMNPPFDKGQDIDHVRHAYDQLKPGGKVVAIMSEGPFFRNDTKATKFREWLKSLGGKSEKLGDKSFGNGERSTGVSTRLVVIEKEKEKVKQPGDSVIGSEAGAINMNILGVPQMARGIMNLVGKINPKAAANIAVKQSKKDLGFFKAVLASPGAITGKAPVLRRPWKECVPEAREASRDHQGKDGGRIRVPEERSGQGAPGT